MVSPQPMLRASELGKLYSAPQVVAQLLGACQDPTITSQALHEIIMQDGSLCAKIIDAAAKICPGSLDPAAPVSSALAGLNLPIIKSLGLQSARTLAASHFNSEQAQFLRQLWFLSGAAGCIAHAAAEAVSYPAPEEAQVTAMLMNIGMLALFSNDPEKYLQNIESPVSSKEVRAQEQVCFGFDHLQLANTLVSGWGFDSFMGDAIRCMHLDTERSRESSLFVRITQLAHEVVRTPFAVNAAAVGKAGQFLNLKETEAADLFRRAESRYKICHPLEGTQEESLQELAQAVNSLSAMVFSLLDQETIRCGLSGAAETVDLISAARQLCLQHSPALESVFFLFEEQSRRLIGLPAAVQSRLVAGLATPLTAANLLAAAAREGRLRHSFEDGAGELTIFDRQLIRVCKGNGIACLPLQIGDRLVGAAVLGLDALDAVQLLQAPNMTWLNHTVASALGSLTASAGKSDGAGNLIPRLAHEIGNPLTIINNYMEVLGNLLAGTEHAGAISAVVNQVERIDDIFKYYLAGKDAPKPSNTGIPLNTAIVSVVESLRPTLFVPKKIEVITDFDKAIGSVATNPVVIRQILVNLLTNAAEALENHGRIVITTREQITSEGLHYVVIGVDDNGSGIDRRLMGRLFSPIASTKGENHAGLGLSIAKGMADDIGATLSCHSTLTSGTTFSLMIPRAG